MDKCPAEIALQIINNLPSSDLKSFSLTSRRYAILAQSILLNHIQIRTRELPSCLRLFRCIWHRIRSVTILGDDCGPTITTLQRLLPKLTRLTSLQVVNLVLHTLELDNIDSNFENNIPAIESLKTLSLRGCESSFAHTQAITITEPKFPSLQALRLSYLDIDSSEFFPAPIPNLTNLTVVQCSSPQDCRCLNTAVSTVENLHLLGSCNPIYSSYDLDLFSVRTLTVAGYLYWVLRLPWLLHLDNCSPRKWSLNIDNIRPYVSTEQISFTAYQPPIEAVKLTVIEKFNFNGPHWHSDSTPELLSASLVNFQSTHLLITQSIWATLCHNHNTLRALNCFLSAFPEKDYSEDPLVDFIQVCKELPLTLTKLVIHNYCIMDDLWTQGIRILENRTSKQMANVNLVIKTPFQEHNICSVNF